MADNSKDPGPHNTSAPNRKDGPTHVAEDAAAPTDITSIPDAERDREVGGQKGLEPTRFGDWEKRGRCTDF